MKCTSPVQYWSSSHVSSGLLNVTVTDTIMECICGKSADVFVRVCRRRPPKKKGKKKKMGVLQFSSAKKKPNLATDISRRNLNTSQNICSAAGRERECVIQHRKILRGDLIVLSKSVKNMELKWCFKRLV